ncbi:MAG: hypothetical protein JW794_08610 [Candidatus Cloacimonetes bacterium]|nr:hypothetical protein [Candidatus Cloacimonadota bacterium]
MKKYMILVVLITIMVSCSSYYVSRQPKALIGSWERTVNNEETALSARLTFKEDQTFSYVINDPVLGRINTHGDISIMSKKIAFLSDLQCKNAGIYSYYIENNNTLVFTLENDMCKIRKESIEGTWQKVK